jgi:RNA polymerase sigma factor (TIGR02999 family)
MSSHDRDSANDEMFNVAYEELRRLAYALKGGRDDSTLTPTALVHEAYLKLAKAGRFRAESPQHLKYTVVRAMKHILIDAARRRSTAMHGGQLRRVCLDDPVAQVVAVNPADVLALGLALEDLALRDQRLARVFELQYFGGFQVAEIASMMEISEKRAQRLLRLAKASLVQALSRGRSASGSDPR